MHHRNIDDRIICAACLRKLTERPVRGRRVLAGALRLSQCLVGVLVLWFFFYQIGEGLLAIPASFHEGTLWQVNWLDK